MASRISARGAADKIAAHQRQQRGSMAWRRYRRGEAAGGLNEARNIMKRGGHGIILRHAPLTLLLLARAHACLFLPAAPFHSSMAAPLFA